jgi:hypothetical protein
MEVLSLKEVDQVSGAGANECASVILGAGGIGAVAGAAIGGPWAPITAGLGALAAGAYAAANNPACTVPNGGGVPRGLNPPRNMQK